LGKRFLDSPTQERVGRFALAQDLDRPGYGLAHSGHFWFVLGFGWTVNARPIVWHRKLSSNHIDVRLTTIRPSGSTNEDTF